MKRKLTGIAIVAGILIAWLWFIMAAMTVGEREVPLAGPTPTAWGISIVEEAPQDTDAIAAAVVKRGPQPVTEKRMGRKAGDALRGHPGIERRTRQRSPRAEPDHSALGARSVAEDAAMP